MKKREGLYKKLIAKVIITAICMVAIVSVMIVGISAGRVERLKVSSIINIPANAVIVDINCNVVGQVNSDKVITTYNESITEDEEIPSWNIGDLEFDGSGEVPIVITILIRNNNIRKLDLAFLIPPDSDKVDMNYQSGSNTIYGDIELTEKQYSSENNYENIESTEDFRILEQVQLESYEYYKMQITMKVKDIKQNFKKIDRNFAVTMAVAGSQVQDN